MKLNEIRDVNTPSSGIAGDEVFDGKKLAPKGVRREEWPKDLDLSNRRTITTLKGCPRVIRGNFIASLTKIENLDGAPEEVYGSVLLARTKITSLKDIHKHIKKCEHLNISTLSIRGPMLGVLKIEGLNYISFPYGKNAEKAAQIINKYLKQPFGNKRVMECQSELLDAGLDEFAEL